MPKRSDGKVHREQEGKCIECGTPFQRPVAGHLRDENCLADEAGYDVMGYCSELCEAVKLKVTFWKLKQDPQMFLAHIYGLDKQTHQDRRRFEDSKRSKAAFA